MDVCVFCGSNPGDDPILVEVAAELGRALADQGHGLVYGGGRVGLMGVVADAALAAGGTVCGVLPRGLADREVGHTGLTELIVTDSMHARKQTMAERSDGFVALPGGYGTLDEVVEILTWNQIGIVAKPVAFLDVPIAAAGGRGYFESLFRFFDDAVGAGLIMQTHRAMAQRALTVDHAIRIATGPAPASPGKWTDPSVR